MSLSKLLPLALAAAVIVGSTTPADAAPLAYTVGDLFQPGGATALIENQLCTIDLATGELTPIGEVEDPDNPFPIEQSIEGLEFDPTTGILYAVTGQEELISIDPATAEATRIATLTDLASGIALNSAGYGLGVLSTGEMFVSAGESGPFFGQLDLATGEVDRFLIGPANAGWPQAVAVDGGDGVFVTDRNSAPEPLLVGATVTPSPGGSATLGPVFGSMGSGINLSIGLDFDDDGVLWGIEAGITSSATANSTIFTVDPTTGARTFVATPTDPGSGLQIRAESLAIAPAPEIEVPVLGLPALGTLVALLGSAGLATRLGRYAKR